MAFERATTATDDDRGHGRVARKLVGITLDKGAAVPSPGAAISSGTREVGSITSAVASPDLGRPIALGYVHRDFVEPGTEVSVATQETATTVTIRARPTMMNVAGAMSAKAHAIMPTTTAKNAITKETPASCHSGPYYSDSSLKKPFKLHDVGTG